MRRDHTRNIYINVIYINIIIIIIISSAIFSAFDFVELYFYLSYLLLINQTKQGNYTFLHL